MPELVNTVDYFPQSPNIYLVTNNIDGFNLPRPTNISMGMQ